MTKPRTWLLAFAVMLILGAIPAFAQSCPVGMLCISQEAGNRMAETARENVLLKEKNAALEDQVRVEKGNVLLVRENAVKSQEALTERLTATSIELANKTGQIIRCDAELTRNTAIMDVLIKNSRPKKVGLINLF